MTPTVTSTPARESRSKALAATSGLGSCIAATTRRMPAWMIRSAQGGVLP